MISGLTSPVARSTQDAPQGLEVGAQKKPHDNILDEAKLWFCMCRHTNKPLDLDYVFYGLNTSQELWH